MALQFGVSHLDSEVHFVKVRRWPFRIGRDPGCDLSLTNAVKISRRHATLRREGDEYLLTVHGSNPTYINGTKVPVNSTLTISSGDCIELPEYRLDVRDTADSANANPMVTEMVQQCDDANIIERKVAAALGIRKWSTAGIYAWLNAHRRRQIVVHHEQIQLRLPSGATEEQLQHRLTAFSQLLELIDLRDVSIQIEDPLSALQSGPNPQAAYA